MIPVIAKVVVTVLGLGGAYALFKKGQPGAIENADPSQTPVNPLTGQMVKPGTAPYVQQVQKSGVAVASAKALHDYLKAHKYDGSPTLRGLVTTFQKATNSDPMAKSLHGPVPTDGAYDSRTAAALTVYTKDPIPAEPSAPPMPPPTKAQVLDASTPGAANISGFNLYSYLKAHGNNNSDDEKTLVRAFQRDVNNDPKFPGPVGAQLVKLITTPLVESGIYDVPTAKALQVDSGEYVAP